MITAGIVFVYACLMTAFASACITENKNPITLIGSEISEWSWAICHGLRSVYVLSLRVATGRKRPDYSRIAKLEQALLRDSKR